MLRKARAAGDAIEKQEAFKQSLLLLAGQTRDKESRDFLASLAAECNFASMHMDQATA